MQMVVFDILQAITQLQSSYRDYFSIIQPVLRLSTKVEGTHYTEKNI